MATGRKYPGAVGRDPQEKIGESLSILDFGARPDGVTGVSAAWNKAMVAAQSLETLTLNIPFGNYAIDDNLVVPANVGHLIIRGQGKSSLFTRMVDMADNTGCFEIFSNNVTFENLAVDGAVLTSVGYAYGTFTDPMATLLTKNTSFWVRGGTKDVTFRLVKITHTGGYAITFDGRDADVTDCLVDACLLENNRPHLFGPSGDLNYGSWTGGIHYQGDCRASASKLFAVRKLKVVNSTFRRGTGNQIWGHLYGFDTLHSDIVTDNNYFTDIGRDGILVGGVTGGSASHNKFRRIGYVATDDTSPAVPKWTAGQWGVGLDTAGLVRNVPYIGNSFMSCYGAAMDLDGYSQGNITANVAKVPYVGEPEYDEDSIAAWIGNYSYGAQISNSNYIDEAGIEVNIYGNTFINQGLGAIRMYASRRCSASENIIHHPATAAVAPIILGNIGNADNRRSYDNSVTYNDIHYEPGSPVAVVQEDANGFPFQSTDINRVYGNRLYGAGIFEFYKDANSGSTPAQEFSSAKAGLTAVDKNILVREDGLFRIYWKKGATTESVVTIIDTVTLPASMFGGPLLNVSLSGVGGVISTAGRTTSAFDDAVLTGKSYVDGFLAIAATTYADAPADLLPDTVGLIRYNATTKVFEQSTAVSGGARVWAAFAGSSLSGLTAGRVPYTTSASAISDSANLAWNNSTQVLTVTGVTGTASIVAATSYIQAAEGFYTPSTSSAAIGVPSGGVTALSLISVRNDGAEGIYLVRNSGANQRSYGFGVDGSGEYVLTDVTAASTRIKISTAGLVSNGNGTFAFDQAGALSMSGVLTTSAGVNVVTTTASNSIQTAGGVTAVSLISVRNDGAAGLTLSRTSSTARNYGLGIDSNGALFVRDETGSAVRILVSTAGLVTIGSSVAIDQAGNLSASAVVAAAGVNVSGTSSNSLQVAAGGLTAKWLVATTSLTFTADTAANAGLSGAGQARIYFDSTSNTTKISQNGGAYVDIATSGVSSITGTANQVIASASTGAVTLSLPQNIHTGATPTFAGMSLSAQLNINTALNSGIAIGGSGQTAVYYVSAAGGPVIGTTSNHPLLFFANNAQRMSLSAAGTLTVGSAVAIDQSGNLTATATITANGVNVIAGSPVYNTLQTNGGVYAVLGATVDQAVYLKTFAGTPNSPGGGYGAISHRSGSTYLYWNGSAWATFDFSASLSGAVLTTTNQEVEGFKYFGVAGSDRLVMYRIADNQLGIQTMLDGQTDPTSYSYGGLNNGLILQPRVGIVGIGSLNGSYNLYVDGTLGVSGTSTFAGVVGMVFNSTATGSTIGFQTSNSNFQVNGDGVVSSAGGINVSGVNVISSARAILGTQLQVDSASLDSQVYVSSAAPRIGLGNHATYGSRTQGARFVMATAGGHFGLPGSGDAFIFTEGVGAGSPGNLYLGAGGQLTLKLDTSNDATFARRVILAGLSAAAGLTVSNGWVDAAAGFFTAVASYEALKATSGGVSVRSLHASTYIQVGQSSGAPTSTSGSTLAAGAVYWDLGLSALRLYDGSAWASIGTSGGITSVNSLTGPALTIAAGTAISVSPSGSTITIANTGVTALTGTANQISVSASTGSVTLSLPQNIHTGASPTFAGVTAGAFSATATGSSIGFQTSNFNFQVDGNGNISGAGSANMTQGFRVNGTTVIDSSRAATNLASVTSSGVLQSQVTGTSIAFQTTNFNFQVNGNGVVSSAGGINVSGSTVINTSRQFVGDGVNVGSNGVSAGGYNVSGGYSGQTWNIGINGGGTFNIGGAGSYTNIQFRGGVIVGAA